MNDPLHAFSQAIEKDKARRNREFGDELDSNFNFRCNSELKEEFKRLCKANQTSPSSVLKRYMLSCIRSSKIV
ncbi:hypothetical protein D0D73_02450 [Vibrio parahaemolyticus]|nr:hypothetical protein [Vibrio parahaemolyticus]EGR1597814.1 hypothetical protein [Vibrio parahaemolyticus]EGR1758633.1 hypothetical protein [Vibrio parahaemolyticus]